MNIEAITKLGYEQYWKQLRQSSGIMVRKWEDLSLNVRMAWIAATKEILDAKADLT
jgi:hypothetical protein